MKNQHGRTGAELVAYLEDDRGGKSLCVKPNGKLRHEITAYFVGPEAVRHEETYALLAFAGYQGSVKLMIDLEAAGFHVSRVEEVSETEHKVFQGLAPGLVRTDVEIKIVYFKPSELGLTYEEM